MKIFLTSAIITISASRCVAAVRYSVVGSFTTDALHYGTASKNTAVVLQKAMSAPNPVTRSLPPLVVSAFGLALSQLKPELERDRMILGPMMYFLPKGFENDLCKAVSARSDDPEAQELADDVADEIVSALIRVEQSRDLKEMLHRQVRQSLAALAEGTLDKDEFLSIVEYLSRFSLYGSKFDEIARPAVRAAMRLDGTFDEEADELPFPHQMKAAGGQAIKKAQKTTAAMMQVARAYLDATGLSLVEPSPEPIPEQQSVAVETIDATPLDWPSPSALNMPNLVHEMDLLQMPRPYSSINATRFPVSPPRLAELILIALDEALPLNMYEADVHRSIFIRDMETDVKVCEIPKATPRPGSKIQIIFRPPEMDHSARIIFLRQALLGYGIVVEATANPALFVVHPLTRTANAAASAAVH